MNRRVAVIADCHSNHLALEAVLADMEARGITEIVNLGDNANGPIDPARTVDRLRALTACHVRGNGDRMTGGAGGESGSSRFARARLGAADLAWLRDLPLQAFGQDWRAFHAMPQADDQYLLEAVGPHGVAIRPDALLRERLVGVTEGLVLCGHSHLPNAVRLSTGQLVVNPGSVGLPAYEDLTPFPHRMETGSPHARYAVVTCASGIWEAELLAVDYAWVEAAALARTHGFEDWALALESGRVEG